MEIRSMIFVSLLIFFIQACTSGSSKGPTQEDIIGTWVSADGATLEFKADGSFIGKNLPSKIVNDPGGNNFDTSGKWSIDASRKAWDQQPWHVSLSFTNTPTGYISATSLIISGSNFMENAPPWQNLFFWVDEEGGERYEFKKK
ncbi:MAG: hypothetical protein ACOYXT_08265 [Bacteroidota bacterium]